MYLFSKAHCIQFVAPSREVGEEEEDVGGGKLEITWSVLWRDNVTMTTANWRLRLLRRCVFRPTPHNSMTTVFGS